MIQLYSSLKPFYEKFLTRGQSYGLSPHEIHELALNLFIKLLSIVILVSCDEVAKDDSNLTSNFQKIRKSFMGSLTVRQEKNRRD